ncbi:MAG: DUF3108 domain-containing protein [Candidatus Omnitrophica bacterium]|nr:DUF3108 domain-containing protein [Candidatus Omnitrophota bacterium]
MPRLIIILVIILSCLLVYTMVNMAPKGYTVEAAFGNRDTSQLPFKEGERFTYQVKYRGLKIGKSILTFHGERDLEGKKAYYITFDTSTSAFMDNEEIFADKDTFLPLEVHRMVKKTIGFTDKIKERYDQENFRVDITQKSKLRKKGHSIEKDAPIHNAILLTYYYRVRENFNKDEKAKITLPTVDFEVMYNGIETIETPMGEQRAYAFTSEPPKFKFWLSADERKIPLKIDNPAVAGYSLIIKSID